jgi:hypothetical protein
MLAETVSCDEKDDRAQICFTHQIYVSLRRALCSAFIRGMTLRYRFDNEPHGLTYMDLNVLKISPRRMRKTQETRCNQGPTKTWRYPRPLQCSAQTLLWDRQHDFYRTIRGSASCFKCSFEAGLLQTHKTMCYERFHIHPARG